MGMRLISWAIFHKAKWTISYSLRNMRFIIGKISSLWKCSLHSVLPHPVMTQTSPTSGATLGTQAGLTCSDQVTGDVSFNRAMSWPWLAETNRGCLKTSATDLVCRLCSSPQWMPASILKAEAEKPPSLKKFGANYEIQHIPLTHWPLGKQKQGNHRYWKSHGHIIVMKYPISGYLSGHLEIWYSF